MIIMQDILSAAAFISAGMHADRLASAVDAAGTGNLEFINAGVSYAPYIVELAEAGYGVTGGYLGVLEYQVCQEFGKLYVGHTITNGWDPEAPPIPDHNAMCILARDLVFEFFTPDGVQATFSRAKLHAALNAVPLPPAPEV